MEHQRPEKIEGYNPPENFVYNSKNNTIYKTFTDSSISDDNIYDISIETGKQYALSGEKILDNCPICNIEAYYTCPCAYSDKKCKNGHIWYTNRCGDIINGDPHKNK